MLKSELQALLDLVPGDPEIGVQGEKYVHDITKLARVGTTKGGAVWHGTPDAEHVVLIVSGFESDPNVLAYYPDDGL